MPPQQALTEPTQVHPRIRLTAGNEPTRLDARSLFEVGEPTVVTAFNPEDPDEPTVTARQSVRVSPISTHTGGAAALTEREQWQAAGRPPLWPDSAQEKAALINRLMNERDERAARRAGRPPVRSVREVALRRAEERARHERHLERIEAARAYMMLAILFGLLVIVVGAGVVGWGILDGWFAWQPVRVTR